jgi:hypothetical protein
LITSFSDDKVDFNEIKLWRIPLRIKLHSFRSEERNWRRMSVKEEIERDIFDSKIKAINLFSSHPSGGVEGD